MAENSAQGSVNLLPFENLDDLSNYSSWKCKMEIYLIHDGLWDSTTETTASDDAVLIKRDQQATARMC
jgi:hypothetical protein